MKFLLIIFFFISTVAKSADRYWVGGHPTNNNWSQAGSGTTNWSATSGGAAGASVPGASDAVIFDVNSAALSSTISATITVLSLTITTDFTGTITHSAVLTIAGNVTFGANYTIAGASAITISAASTITSNGKTWPNGVTFSGANTKVLSGNWVVTGTLTISASTVLNWTTNETLSAGGLTVTAAGVSGTATIILTGGTWQGGQAVQNSLSIAGNVTVSGSVAYNTGTLTYTSGTVTTTGSTVSIGASTTLNTNGVTWNNITLSATQTLTLNSLLSVSGTLMINAAVSPVVFAGTHGFSAATFNCTHTTTASITLKNSITYTITTAFTAFTSRTGAIITFASDDGTVKAILTLNQGATCNVLASFTRIDASAGRTIWTFNGTVTDCTNVKQFNDLKTVAKPFIQ